MVEASVCDTQDPQTFDKDLHEVNLILAQNPKPILCLEHKMEVAFVSKLDLAVLCTVCIVEHKPDSNNLVLFTKYAQQKRKELRNLF